MYVTGNNAASLVCLGFANVWLIYLGESKYKRIG